MSVRAKKSRKRQRYEEFWRKRTNREVTLAVTEVRREYEERFELTRHKDEGYTTHGDRRTSVALHEPPEQPYKLIALPNFRFGRGLFEPTRMMLEAVNLPTPAKFRAVPMQATYSVPGGECSVRWWNWEPVR